MSRLMALIGSAILLAGMTAPTFAQADAQAAYQQAKAAYQAGKFTAARDLAEQAATTDPKNAEVLLLLGKARYELGELDEALAAWKQTLALAPQEPFATRMLEVLRARRADVDTRIKLVEAMRAERLFVPAWQESHNLLENKTLTDGQRAKVLTLQAHLAIRMGNPDEALKLLREVLTLYPKQADAVETSLLLGQAKLLAGGDAAAEGLDLLKQLIAKHAGTPAAAVARYECIVFALGQGVEPARVEALAAWLAENPKHERAGEGRRKLIDWYLTLTREGPRAAADAALAPTDVQALAVSKQFAAASVRTEEVQALAEQWVKHWDGQYAGSGAFAAAAAGADDLLTAALPRPARLTVLRAAARYKIELALARLAEQARAGRLPATVETATLPTDLAAAVAACDAINQEAPAQPAWGELAQLAVRTRQLASGMALPDRVVALRGPDAWAVAIALPVIGANADAAAVAAAVGVVAGTIHDALRVDQPAARLLALALSRRLLAAPLSPKHPAWVEAMNHHAALLDGQAKFQFYENVKAGRDADNAKLSDMQREFIETLAKVLAVNAAQGSNALQSVAQHVKPWKDRGHWGVAEEVYVALAKSLPPQQQRDARLAIVQLWMEQVFQRDRRLAAAGLTVPRELDATLKKALLSCYELQAGLEPESPVLRQVRHAWDAIAAHYRRLEYDDVAEAAMRVKTEQAVPAAAEYADFQLICLHEEQARRELARQWKQYDAAEKIALTPALKDARDAWKKFIAAQPASPLATAAVERIFAIGTLLEQQGAFAAAAEVYSDLAAFAAADKVLSASAPGVASTLERAEFAAAAALDAQARKDLSKALAERKPDDAPPAKLSEPFAAANAAYKAFIVAHADSPLVGDALRRAMGIALEYAQRDAWEVAEGVYADLQKAKLSIRRPERLEFARGVCQLGRAMPAHAKEILTALSSTGLGSGIGEGEEVSGATELAASRYIIAKPQYASVPKDAVSSDDGGGGGSGSGSGATTLNAGDLVLDTPATPMPAAAAPSPAAPAASSGAGSAQTLGRNYNQPQEATAEARRDNQLLAMIQRQEANRSARVAQLGSNPTYNALAQQPVAQQEVQQGQQQQMQVPTVVLSEAELARLQRAFDAAYEIFQGLRKNYADSPTAAQARAEILVMIGHWRGLTQWQRAATLALQFLGDNPSDPQLPRLRLEVARDRMAWAAKPIEKKMTRQELLAEVSGRFAAARAALSQLIADFPKERECRQEAQWDIAGSFLTEARVIGGVSPTLARGQFVRAARELRAVAEKYPNHPRIGEIPQMLWNVAEELVGRGYEEEAIVVWNELAIYDPLHPLAQQAALRIAETYQQALKRPLKAAEAYMELNFVRGGDDRAMQDAIFAIGSSLKNDKRWVESLHVLETFVDSFPRHPQAGQALTMVGQIHQANEAWPDAIAAYRRVIAEYKEGQWVQEAKWAIAECTINLSQWHEASDAYRDYVAAYPQDSKLAEANRRIEVLKDLARFQGLADEKGQRKAFDAQFQIATIVRSQLANPVKAIIEYRKVVKNWPESYVAASALYEIGTSYLALGETAKAREALQAVGRDYPTSPLAGPAMFMVGKSYEDEADKLATVTREKSLEYNKDIAQREAYQQVQTLRGANAYEGLSRIENLKKSGKGDKEVEFQEAANATSVAGLQNVGTQVFAQKAQMDVETLTSTQLADRQDKINAALRKAIDAYAAASKIPGGNKADAALLQMATIYDQRLKDSKAAMETWLEIVRQFSGTAVAEDASWKLAQYYDHEGRYTQAIEAYNSFLRNYRRSPNAGPAQFAVAECYEHLGQWVSAMDSYNNYLNNFADGPLAGKAKEQIGWIKTYRL